MLPAALICPSGAIAFAMHCFAWYIFLILTQSDCINARQFTQAGGTQGCTNMLRAFNVTLWTQTSGVWDSRRCCLQLWKVPADMCILNADMCILNASFQVSSNRSHSHTVFFADICTFNASWNFLSGPISQQGFLISTFNVVETNLIYHRDECSYDAFNFYVKKTSYAILKRKSVK